MEWDLFESKSLQLVKVWGRRDFCLISSIACKIRDKKKRNNSHIRNQWLQKKKKKKERKIHTESHILIKSFSLYCDYFGVLLLKIKTQKNKKTSKNLVQTSVFSGGAESAQKGRQ